MTQPLILATVCDAPSGTYLSQGTLSLRLTRSGTKLTLRVR